MFPMIIKLQQGRTQRSPVLKTDHINGTMELDLWKQASRYLWHLTGEIKFFVLNEFHG
jgi:hypothetical protein